MPPLADFSRQCAWSRCDGAFLGRLRSRRGPLANSRNPSGGSVMRIIRVHATPVPWGCVGGSLRGVLSPVEVLTQLLPEPSDDALEPAEMSFDVDSPRAAQRGCHKTGR